MNNNLNRLLAIGTFVIGFGSMAVAFYFGPKNLKEYETNLSEVELCASNESNTTRGTQTIGVKNTDHIGCDWTVGDNFIIKKLEEKSEAAFENTPLTYDMFKTWDGFDASATVVGEHPYWDAVELGTTVGPGNTVYGSGNVTNTDYADVTGANVLRIEGTSGLQLRVLLNRQADESLVELNPVVGDNGYVDVDLTSFEYVHINAIKLGWGSPSGTVTALILNPTGTPTAIGSVNNATTVKNGKFLENNKVVIYRNGVKYNVNGAVIK